MRDHKIFDLIDLPFIKSAKTISSQRTRLGGEIYYLTITPKIKIFMKIGTGYERLEIMREYENISSLQNYMSVPIIYDYVQTDDYAAILLKEVIGYPLQNLFPILGRQSSLSIIKDILNVFSLLPNSIKSNFDIAALTELKDIKFLIDNNKIKRKSFMMASNGISPERAYYKIQNDLKNHTIQTLSHGDLCLPNILVTLEGKWSLIDWGKGGIGDLCRDLSSLEGSLKRNIDENAYSELCEMMNIKINSKLQKKIDLYKLIDLYWYNLIL